MAKNNYLDKYTVDKFTTADREEVFANSKLNKAGYPEFYPSTDKFGKRIAFTFLDFELFEKDGVTPYLSKIDFTVYDGEVFNPSEENAEEKVKALGGFFSNKYVVKGAVYLNGENITKVGSLRKKQLLKRLIHRYFSIEDGELILKYFEKDSSNHLVYYPRKSRDGSKELIFSAVDASISSKENPNVIADEHINFSIFKSDILDLKKKEDMQKAEVIKSLLDKDRVVKGFYYKGEQLPLKLSTKFKLYLEKSFVKKNFTVDQRDYLFTTISKDRKTGYPLFWPMQNKEGREIVISVVNAVASWIDCEKYSNFDVYTDELFDLTKDDFKMKLKIVEELLERKSVITGALYLDGVLIPGIESASEIDRRKSKVEKALKIYIENNKDFVEISNNFTIENREQLLRLGNRYDHFYPESSVKAPRLDKEYNHSDVIVKFVNVNVVDEQGNKVFANDLNAEFKYETTSYSKDELLVFKALFDKKSIVSGGVFYKGKNVAKRFFKRLPLADEFLRKILSKDDFKAVVAPIIERKNKYEALYATEDELKDLILKNKNGELTEEDNFLAKKEELSNSIKNQIKVLKDLEKTDKDLLAKSGKGSKLLDFDYFKHSERVLKVVNANFLDEKGNYVLKENLNATFTAETKEYSPELLELFKAICNNDVKVRGGVFYKGKNIARHSVSKKKFMNEYLPTLLSTEDMNAVIEYSKEKKHVYLVDTKSKMPIYWPTTNSNGREVLLSVVDANVWFKVGRQTIKACNNMNFDIYTGETFGLVGESGSGKTTISRAILGINKLSKGGIYFKGKLISGKLDKAETKSTKKNIQMIFQDPAASLNERANIDYIISEGLYNFKLFKTQEERLEKVSTMLRSVGLLPEHLSRYPHEFSGGQRQRIGIARALVIEPQLVLADEPISALDVSIRAQVLNLLRKLQKEQDLTYLFIAHDLSIIRYISDRIAVMHKGYVVELGPAEEIYSNPLHPYTRSLLTAIPQPDPKTKDQRKKIPYNQGNIVYGKCKWKDYGNEHFVLVNDELDSDITKRIKKK